MNDRRAGDWRGDAGTLAELGGVLLNLAAVKRSLIEPAVHVVTTLDGCAINRSVICAGVA